MHPRQLRPRQQAVRPLLLQVKIYSCSCDVPSKPPPGAAHSVGLPGFGRLSRRPCLARVLIFGYYPSAGIQGPLSCREGKLVLRMLRSTQMLSENG